MLHEKMRINQKVANTHSLNRIITTYEGALELNHTMAKAATSRMAG
jgi:hypothetical protein